MDYLEKEELLTAIRDAVNTLLVIDNDVRPLKFKFGVLKPKKGEKKRFYLNLNCKVSIPESEDSD